MSREEIGSALDEPATDSAASAVPTITVPASTLAGSTLVSETGSTLVSETGSTLVSEAGSSLFSQIGATSSSIPGAGLPTDAGPQVPVRTGTAHRDGALAAGPAPLSVRRRLVAASSVALLGVGIGWLAGGAWNASGDQPSPLHGPTAAATVIDVRPSSDTAVRTGADLIVQISNLGTGPLTLTGAEASFDAAEVTAVSPQGLQIAAGTSTTAVLHAAIACGSPQPLRLPALTLRGSDRVLRSIPIDGDAAALARICTLQPAAVHLLELVSAAPDGARLRLQVRSPTGRTTEVNAVSARGVALTGRPIPGTVDALGRTIWIDPPATCPNAWLHSGLPRTLDLRLDAGGDSTVSLDLGFTFARWLRAGPCSGQDR